MTIGLNHVKMVHFNNGFQNHNSPIGLHQGPFDRRSKSDSYVHLCGSWFSQYPLNRIVQTTTVDNVVTRAFNFQRLYENEKQ